MKQLCKSNTNRKIAGVCGGIGEYFGIDPTLVRLGFVALSLLAGGGVAVYNHCRHHYAGGGSVEPLRRQDGLNVFYAAIDKSAASSYNAYRKRRFSERPKTPREERNDSICCFACWHHW